MKKSKSEATKKVLVKKAAKPAAKKADASSKIPNLRNVIKMKLKGESPIGLKYKFVDQNPDGTGRVLVLIFGTKKEPLAIREGNLACALSDIFAALNIRAAS